LKLMSKPDTLLRTGINYLAPGLLFVVLLIPLLSQIHTPVSEPSMPNALSEREKVLYGHKMDINRAQRDDLMLVSGIGPKIAQSILDWRRQHGPIYRLEELLEIKGIGGKRLQQIKKWFKIYN